MLTALSTYAHDFTYEYNDQTLTYTIIDENSKTCKTKEGYMDEAGNPVTGNLIIPEIARDGDTEYTVISISDYAFNGCWDMTSIVIPNTVTSIGFNAFAYCTGLTKIEIPGSVTSIDEWAFFNCTGLTSIEIPGSLTSIGDYAFLGCSGLTAINVDINNPNYSSIDGVLFNRDKTILLRCPEGLDGDYIIPQSVTSINDYAFAACNDLTSIEIPNSVISIGESAFESCRSLTSVEIPASVASIGDLAFCSCSNLTSVEIHDAATSIGEGAFEFCDSLTSVELGNSVTSIGDSAFYDSCLTSIEIPGSVTSIGDRAFLGCSRLTAINVDVNNPNYSSTDGVLFNRDKTILIRCPEGLTGDYDVPQSVTSINNYALFGCSGLYSIEIPNSVTSIGDSAFYGCSGLTSIEIPDSVTSIGKSAFQLCYSLTSIVIPDSVTSIGDLAFNVCLSLTSVEISNSVTSIGYSTFAECSDLTSIVIPNSVTSIGEWVFAGCTGLKSIVIPHSVTSIGNTAFVGCSNITSVYYDAEDPVEFNKYVFSSDNYSKATLYVPETAVEKSKLIDPWKNFNTIQAFEFNGIEVITEDIDSNLPCEVYNLAGVKVADSTEDLNPGLYIIHQGSAVKKIVVK